MNVLVTGGLGYIGATVCVALLESGHGVVILDNLSNSVPLVADRIKVISRRELDFVRADVRDTRLVGRTLYENGIDAVVHLAGSKSVSESIADPAKYYCNNISGTLSLLAAMAQAKIKALVFSSSATVYGEPASVPIREWFPRSATSPYGRSKLMQEDILADLAASDASWRIMSLRYFNPIGAHESGLIGEDPKGVPNNLMPYILQVAIGRRPELRIFGDDYNTPDGTCVRDFIHVQDLAEGHLAALAYLTKHSGYGAVNLGTGRGASVLELCGTVERTTSRKVPRRIVGRRAGDVAVCWADVILQWQARRNLEKMSTDAWNWQVKNPNGYEN